MMNSKLEQLLMILAATLDSLRHEGYEWYVGDRTLDVYHDDENALKHVASVSSNEYGETEVTHG